MNKFLGVPLSLMIVLVTVASFTVTRVGAQTATPFNGFPFALPATIECEQFDKGGLGVGYDDTDWVNTGGKYRTADYRQSC
jgi:hypothetical protein